MSRRQRNANHNNAGENLHRQLTAPAHKWRKAWVAPTGQQPESSYRVCRWVKVGKNDKDAEDEANVEEGEDEDDVDGEGGDEDDNENEEDVDEEDEGEGEGEVEGSSDKPADTGPISTPAAGTASEAPTKPPSDDVSTPPTIVTSTQDPSTVIPPKSDETSSLAPAVATSAAGQTTSPASAEATATLPPSTSSEGSAHTAIPSNAMELSNTAPNHTEDGGLNHSTAEAGIEITQPTSEPSSAAPLESEPAPAVQVGSLGQNEEKMDVDEPKVEKGEAVEEDAGLVMGEMVPPEGEKGLENTEMDQVKETEPEAGEDTRMGDSTA